MYAGLWRALPGPLWLRLILVLLLLAVVLVALAAWIFPWLESIIGPREATVAAAVSFGLS